MFEPGGQGVAQAIIDQDAVRFQIEFQHRKVPNVMENTDNCFCPHMQLLALLFLQGLTGVLTMDNLNVQLVSPVGNQVTKGANEISFKLSLCVTQLDKIVTIPKPQCTGAKETTITKKCREHEIKSFVIEGQCLGLL